MSKITKQISAFFNYIQVITRLLFYLFSFYQKRRDLLAMGSLPKCLQQSRLGQAEARSTEPNLGVPRGWHLLSLRVYGTKKLDGSREPDSNQALHPGINESQVAS